MVSAVNKVIKTPKLSDKMGELVKLRKRHRSDYQKVEEDIEFLIDVKRPKLSEDDVSEDRNSPDLMKQIASFKLSTEALSDIKLKEVPSVKVIEQAKPVVAAKNNNNNKDTVKDTEDTREFNRRSPNGFLLPDPLPRGEVLTDTIKQQWVLGKAIGVGGFGELYMASFLSKEGKKSPEKFVVKVEPHSNGPLFVEVHFYLRATMSSSLEEFKKTRGGLDHLGVPKLVANGSHMKKGQKYRFLVMERFGSDIQRILDNSEGNRFNTKTACSITIQVLDCLEYIHSQGYVHKDVKGSNLLVGLGLEGQHRVHLVDYGLCSKFRVGDLHKQYRHDTRWAHEGTMEYTSRDAHIGSASRRGDLEVLFYNLVEWFGGALPWDRECSSPELTKTAKFMAFRNMPKFLKICFRGKGYPAFLLRFMKYVGGLMFETEPDYDFLRGLVYQEMVDSGCSIDNRLEFKLAGLNDRNQEQPTLLEPSLLFGPSKKPPSFRLSKVFDTACISATSYEQKREELWAERSAEALLNPTPAMVEIQNKLRQAHKQKQQAQGRHRKRTKSCTDEKTDQTPAMMEVIKLRKMKSMDEANIELFSPERVVLRRPYIQIAPCPVIPYSVACPPDISDDSSKDSMEDLIQPRERQRSQRRLRKMMSSPEPDFSDESSKDSMDDLIGTQGRKSKGKQSFRTPKACSGGRKGELKRIASFLDDPLERRRTRSEIDVRGDREIRGNLRSAFSFGLAPVRNFMRQVSGSLQKLF